LPFHRSIQKFERHHQLQSPILRTNAIAMCVSDPSISSPHFPMEC
jgi:hypothetical protein